MKKRVGILISGRGSNMMALVEAARAPDYPAEIAARRLQPAGGAGPGAGACRGHQGAGDRPQGLRHARGLRRRRRAALQRGGHRPRLPGRASCASRAPRSPPAGWGGSSTSTPRCCRPSRGCTRSSRRSMPACASPAARCISSRRSSMRGRSSPRRRCRCCPATRAETLADRILTAEHKLYPFALRLVATGRGRAGRRPGGAASFG